MADRPPATAVRPLRVAVTGASGLVGACFCELLAERGHETVRLVRRTPARSGEAEWRPAAGLVATSAVEGLDALVHLAGESIASGRWSETRKQAIRDSRVAGTAALVRSFEELRAPPRVFVCASATGFYGDRGDRRLDESAAPGEGFLAEVCVAWEAAARGAERTCERVALTRFGVVLSSEGGALARMLLPFRLGLGGPIDAGRQYMPWIALADVGRALIRVSTDDTLRGPVNFVAPEEATNRDFTRALGRALHRPTALRVPAFALRVALGREMADELLLASARVVPARLTEHGFEFAHPRLDGALQALLGSG